MPERMPPGEEIHDGYELRRTQAVAGQFGGAQPIQYWTDLLAAGLRPGQVKLLGIGGGDIAGFEYRLALALGAQVALLRESGRAADRLLADGDWRDGPNLAPLPSDAATIKAFAYYGAESGFDSDLRDDLAREVHEKYRADKQAGAVSQDPAMAEWEELLPALKASNFAQVDFVERLLAEGGLKLRKVEARAPVLYPIGKEPNRIDRMARLEHGRFVAERTLAGWRPGPRDPVRKTSPYLVPWDDLADDVKSWDIGAVKAIPEILAKHGYEVYEP